MTKSALALLLLSSLLGDQSDSQRKRLLKALINRNVSEVYLQVGPRHAEILSPLLQCSSELLEEIGKAFKSNSAGVADLSGDGESGSTHFGGIFLLLPLLSALPIESATETWPDVSANLSASSFTRFLVLIKSLGANRALSVFADPLVRDVMQIGRAVTLSDVSKWQAKISRSKLVEFMRQLALAQCRERMLRASRLVLSSVSAGRSETALLIDTERGCWVFGDRFKRNQPEQFIDRACKWLSNSDVNPEMIFADAGFTQSLRKALPTVEVLRLEDADDVRSEDSALDVTLRLLPHLQQDLSYLEFPKAFQVSAFLDLALSVAAQTLMRTFASRLPGFARSGLPYLNQNFLDLSATLETELNRYVIKLGRPPLNIIISMAGLARASYKLDWNDSRPFTLFQEA